MQGNTAVSTGSGFSSVQVDVHAADYGKTHKFVITADPDNVILERDENDNTITVTLPPRPNSTVDLPCSIG